MMKYRRLFADAAAAVAVAAACLSPVLVAGEPLTDIRGIAVGMSVQQLPVTGYRDLTCLGRPIPDWDDWASCPVGAADGLRAVHVAYDQPGEQTKVAGHPVDLTVFFDGAGRVARIGIRTDDRAVPFLHKKAYMLARQAKAHYGEEGWTCKTIPAAAEEEPLGPLYVNETCTKRLAERQIELSDRLFRRKGAGPRDYVSDTTISIGLASSSPAPAASGTAPAASEKAPAPSK